MRLDTEALHGRGEDGERLGEAKLRQSQSQVDVAVMMDVGSTKGGEAKGEALFSGVCAVHLCGELCLVVEAPTISANIGPELAMKKIGSKS